MFKMITKNYSNAKTVPIIGIKSKLGNEFRRISILKSNALTYIEFSKLLKNLHKFNEQQSFSSDVRESYPIIRHTFKMYYLEQDLKEYLPINNDDNCKHAIETSIGFLRIFITTDKTNLSSSRPKSTIFSNINSSKKIEISEPKDFRHLSTLIGFDDSPSFTTFRVRLCKNKNETKSLGFYIRDGSRNLQAYNQLLPGIFISRLVPGGLAEATGLLAIDDEILEVNGIEVIGKSLDQVTDMMIANSSNLIITVRPSNDHRRFFNKISSKNTLKSFASSQQTNNNALLNLQIQTSFNDVNTQLKDDSDSEFIDNNGIIHI